jgi:hypothetical protein
MLTKLILAILLVAASVAGATVKPGDNLVVNGTFEGPGRTCPSYWDTGGSCTSCNPTGGPNNTGALIFSNPAGQKSISSFCRQYDQQLVAGETYKMSATVKTVGFKSAHAGVIVHDNGWHKEYGLKSFPENTNGWQSVEQTFKLEESKNGVYGVAIFAISYVGEIQFAQVKLEAISAGALAGSSQPRLLLEQTRPRLVAWEPLLNAIPLTDPKITFRLFGKPERALTEYDCVGTVDGQRVRKNRLVPDNNVVDLSGLAAGDHRLNVALVERATQTKVFEITHVITLTVVPKVDASAHRRLNNLAVEVLAQPLKATGAAQRFEFSTVRDGWVFIKVETTAPEPALDVRLGTRDAVVTATTARREAFRELPRGTHSLVVKGAGSGGKVVVRAIAEVFNYPACGSSQIPQNGLYDWDFHVRHVFPAVTTLNGGAIPEEHRAEVRRMGLRWLANVGTTEPKDAADLVKRMSDSPGMTAPMYDGFTNDEQFFGSPALVPYTEALRLVPNPENRLIYTWIVGKPGMPGVHNDFISAALNVSRGRGRLLFEIYCHSRPSEQDATNYLNDRLADTMTRLSEYFPKAAAGTGLVLGNFNQIPIISLDVNPEVDYKYYLDMQLHLIATDPACKDLALTGYWGSYYDDEELYRWSMRLLRHYCVEGHTEMLSPTYGYRYAPGHLSNCDFANGLKGWTADPADGVRAASFSGYGRSSEGRWGADGGAGDTFCVFKRGAGGPSTLTQTATGLTPGKVYTLQFITADYKDMVAHKVDPKEHRLSAVLGTGAELIPAKSYVYVDRRTAGAKANDTNVRINLHHIRFRATGTSLKVTFTDAAAEPGTETALNYVMLKPYFGD